MPVHWEESLSKTEIVRLRVGNIKAMDTHKSVPIWRRVGNYLEKDKVLVFVQLPVPLISREQFIDSNVAITKREDQTLTRVDGNRAELVRQKNVRFTLCRPASPLFSIQRTQVGLKCIRNRVVMLEPIRQPPNSQTTAKILTGRPGAMIIEPDRNTLVSQNTSACNGLNSVVEHCLSNC